MSSNFLSINKGQIHVGDVLVATSAPTADVYLQISSTNSPKKEDVILAMRLIEQYLLGNGVPGGSVGVDLPVI